MNYLGRTMALLMLFDSWRRYGFGLPFPAFADGSTSPDAADQIEDHFQITRLEPGKVWLTGLIDGRERGPIQLPDEISRRCQVGWTVSGVIGRIGRRWQFLEAWNVYPL